MTFQHRAYYRLRRFIPRDVQISLRRWRAQSRRVRVLDAWPIDPATGHRPEGFDGWPQGKSFAVVLRHDVEWESGTGLCDRIRDLERRFGFRSAFYFVPKRYRLDPAVRTRLLDAGCEIGVHGLTHDGFLYSSRRVFLRRAEIINQILREWNASGFASPSSHHRLEWLHDLDIAYDSSTFDTDPFEPQPDALGSIFPVRIRDQKGTNSYVELPYTVPQDFTLFVILQEDSIDIWKKKIAWIAQHGGMVLVNTHPDYMRFDGSTSPKHTYPVDFYIELLHHIQTEYRGDYWHALPRDVASFWCQSVATTA